MHCYLVNTGGIGEGEEFRKIKLEDTLRILDALLRNELKKWVDSPTGFQVPADVRSVEDISFHPERLYSQAEFETRQAELNKLRHESIEAAGDGLHRAVREVF